MIALTGIPICVELRKDALVFHTRTCGLIHLYAPHAKGVAMGNIAIVRRDQPEKILAHELVHVEQHMRHPFIQPFLYWYELLTKGYWNNKYEIEAYNRTDTWPEEQRRL